MGYGGLVEERDRAREIRSRSCTLAEIARTLAVSKSSVSVWVRDVPFERRPRSRGHASQNAHPLHLERKADFERAAREAHAALGSSLSDRELMVAGIALYAGEGSKTDNRVVIFTNSDGRMIDLYLRWLRRFFDIDESRLRLRLTLHDDQDLLAAQTNWSVRTGIPVSQFSKAIRPRRADRHARSKHPFGCVGIVYSSASIHRSIVALCDALLTSDFAFRDSSAGRAIDC
jgi:hypothetical protein